MNEDFLNDTPKECPCPKVQCPNHGDCKACALYHKEFGGLVFCRREEASGPEADASSRFADPVRSLGRYLGRSLGRHGRPEQMECAEGRSGRGMSHRGSGEGRQGRGMSHRGPGEGRSGRGMGGRGRTGHHGRGGGERRGC